MTNEEYQKLIYEASLKSSPLDARGQEEFRAGVQWARENPPPEVRLTCDTLLQIIEDKAKLKEQNQQLTEENSKLIEKLTVLKEENERLREALRAIAIVTPTYPSTTDLEISMVECARRALSGKKGD